jgi:SAM-dependent methyltransferase
VSGTVAWHDLECGGYAEDLALWQELATSSSLPPGPILDVGAGTGRVTLDLARAGHEVVALDVDPELLAALSQRAGGLPVTTVVADARDFALGRRFRLIVVPMQTVQLLEGRHDDLLACAARHLAPGGLLAASVANPPAYEGELRPLPDIHERGGWIWASQPVALRNGPSGLEIERVRELVSPTGERSVSGDVVTLAPIEADELEACGRDVGLTPLPRRTIGETDDYAGSDVVILRG